MVSRMVTLALLAALVDGDPPLPPAITHDEIACVRSDTFPQLSARIEPPDMARVRLRFRPDAGTAWYSVPMKRDGDVWVGVLPKPRSSMKQFEYSILAIDAAVATSQTPEFRPVVESGPAACQGKKVALGVASALLHVEAPAGAPLVPTGFASSGVVAEAAAAGASSAAAGGGSKALLLALAGGGVAAGAVVATGGGGGDGGSEASGDGPRATTPSPSPAGSPSASPSPGSPGAPGPTNPSPGGGTFAVYGVVLSTFGPNPANPTGPGVYGPPVAGAVVSISLDGSSTSTDGEGRFALVTGTRYPVCTTSTLTIAAPGHATYNASGYWGNNPDPSSAWTFSLSPPIPASGGAVPTPCP